MGGKVTLRLDPKNPWFFFFLIKKNLNYHVVILQKISDFITIYNIIVICFRKNSSLIPPYVLSNTLNQLNYGLLVNS